MFSLSSNERPKFSKKDLTKQLLKQELKKSNKIVDKIKRGRTIFDEKDFRRTIEFKHKSALQDESVKDNLNHYLNLSFTS